MIPRRGCSCSARPYVSWTGPAGSAVDEGRDQADEGQRLGEGGTEEGVGAGQAGGLGLTGGRLDVGGPHDAHTDAGADGGEAVADRADVALELCENLDHWGVFLLCRSPGVVPGGWRGGAVSGRARPSRRC